eukprot:CAMPEP_0196827026 /NCGR_PEP_ID=MMETSP1362-20130617/93940_1 /TAXON_ID=163516 /ORGANISM="Leptocylindrus danicus, Strain CCMP1856" /LENGTH=476 /DNA_ID=CAMNT_0042207639 /DNA_START=533 /DNA_END=1959 /DNA_ORIENTATION=-
MSGRDNELHPKTSWQDLVGCPNRNWRYLAEGNAHAIFERTDTDGDQVISIPVILRIAKYLKNDNINDTRQDFVSNVLEPNIGKQYLNEPLGHVRLTRGFIADLQQHCVAANKVPALRLSQWTKKPDKDQWSLDAFVHINVARQHRGIVLEITPKCGFLCSSPLVQPEHRIKFRRHRYGLFQELMSNGLLRKGWMSGNCDAPFIPSSYSPLKFFSGEISNVESSMLSLFERPQNNLRIWCNGQIIYGHDKMNLTVKDFEAIQQAILSNVEKAMVFQSLASLVGAILTREPLIQNILKLQKADLIDVDGMVRVYDRLVEICGTQEAAEACINYPFCPEFHIAVGDVCSFIPFSRPDCMHLDELMHEVQKFADALPGQKETNDPFLDEKYEYCLKIVQKLPKESCVWILQGWLISLAMCDLSIMIGVSPGSLDEGDRMQNLESCGSISLEAGVCNYSLKLVDYDPKPSTKLRNRGKQER